jgi:hypothetical protein
MVMALAHAPSAKSQTTQPSSPTTIRVVRVEGSDGFHWGDAAIGAAGVVALTAIAFGAVVAASYRSDRRRSSPHTT